MKQELKLGDLVEYIPYYLNPETAIRGLILQVEGQPEGYSNTCNIRVRWFDHTDSQRDWYAQDELTVISKCMHLK